MLRNHRNCDGKSNPKYGDQFGGELFTRCPLAERSEFTRRAMRHYQRYTERGLLPRPGGTAEQEPRLMQAFDIIDSEKNIIMSKRRNR